MRSVIQWAIIGVGWTRASWLVSVVLFSLSCPAQELPHEASIRNEGVSPVHHVRFFERSATSVSGRDEVGGVDFRVTLPKNQMAYIEIALRNKEFCFEFELAADGQFEARRAKVTTRIETEPKAKTRDDQLILSRFKEALLPELNADSGPERYLRIAVTGLVEIFPSGVTWGESGEIFSD
ncbi:MAG: hypothetical protein HY900_19925 [Deltaproteobacteria bacterium]|nr:hypothetical protein [Deltaproteobacteria bacterium]